MERNRVLRPEKISDFKFDFFFNNPGKKKVRDQGGMWILCVYPKLVKKNGSNMIMFSPYLRLKNKYK